MQFTRARRAVAARITAFGFLSLPLLQERIAAEEAPRPGVGVYNALCGDILELCASAPSSFEVNFNVLVWFLYGQCNPLVHLAAEGAALGADLASLLYHRFTGTDRLGQLATLELEQEVRDFPPRPPPP